MHGQNHIKFVC